jgi:phosphohistidine swiveling domain-containing protein
MDNAQRIKNIAWELRVTRPGLFQPRGITNEAEIMPVQLTRNITAKYDHVGWVGDMNLYDDIATKSFANLFTKAFKEDRNWPLKIIDFFDKITPKVNQLIQALQETDWDKQAKKEKINSFLEYVQILKEIQKYYTIAVPLTRYCEKQLTKENIDLSLFAYPFKRLDIDHFQTSKNPLKEFAWIKTAYNIRRELKTEDIQKVKHEIKHKEKNTLPEEQKHLIIGLQVGIYTRNRMKELSQQLWYYIEPLTLSMCNDFNITRELFYKHTYHEILQTYKEGTRLSKEELKSREKDYCIAIIDNKEIIITGEEANELIAIYSSSSESQEVKGRCACQGKVTGTVKVILNHNQFKELNKGDILVTTMTTPDFVVLMEKAGAIITDEGGLSCHAAIVSREINVPCIIGTKNATKVLKSGELIEVDADKGTIKRITQSL